LFERLQKYMLGQIYLHSKDYHSKNLHSKNYHSKNYHSKNLQIKNLHSKNLHSKKLIFSNETFQFNSAIGREHSYSRKMSY